MSTEVKIRRGTTAENNAFTGVEGELTYDTQSQHIITHDGVTPGGFRAVKVPGDTMTGPLGIVVGSVVVDTPILDLSQTWNNAAVVFDAIQLNITNLASSTDSSLLDLKVDGSPAASIRRRGSQLFYRASPDNTAPSYNSFKRGTTGDATLPPVDDDTLMLLNGQGWNGAAYQVGFAIQADADETFSTTSAGSRISFRTPRRGSTALNTLVRISNSDFMYFPLWDAIATTFTAFQLTLTDTASAADSLFQDFKLNSVSRFKVGKLGVTTISYPALGVTVTDGLILQNLTAAAVGAQQISPAVRLIGRGWGTTAGTSQSVDWKMYNLPVQSTVPIAQLTWASSVNASADVIGMYYRDNGTLRVFVPAAMASTGQLALVAAGETNARARFMMDGPSSGGRITFSDGTTTADVSLGRFAANHLSLNLVANPQTLSIARTFTSVTNYEMLFLGWTGTDAHVWTEKGSGGGTGRPLVLGSDATPILTLTASGVTHALAKTLTIAAGANQRAGNATLVAGTVTVANTTVTGNTIVMLTRKTSGGTIGTAITYTVTDATSFTITSDSVLDTSTFSYLLIEVV